ncbi:MAG: BON domain-containing protein [Proteobacteria bacterium]|nr:BON domain-containing protein [Pseudomonadota bacterium]
MTSPQFSYRPRFSILSILLSFSLCACASFSSDPRDRTPGAVIDDQILESSIKRAIKDSDDGFDDARISVVSYNGIVLLVGQVATDGLKAKAQTVSEAVRNVRTVHNELQVSAPISFLARTNDSWITSKVKTKFAVSGDVDADAFKVVTEDGSVYLMGLIPRSQALRAVDVAATAYGVQRIVKVFEYLD